MTTQYMALAANRATGLYQTNSLTFTGADQPVWKHIGGALGIRQMAWKRDAPWEVQACLAETLTDVYIRAPAVYGLNWTLVLTSAAIQAKIGNANPGVIRWVEYNTYLPGHMYVAWQYNLTLGGLWCLRSADYGANWTAHSLFVGVTNYGIDCIEAGRLDSVTGTYGNGGVLYATCRTGVGAPPSTWRSFNDGVNWSVGDNDTGAANEQKLIKVDPLDLVTTYTDQMPGAGVHNLARSINYAVNFVDIDGVLNVGLMRDHGAIWIKSDDGDVIAVYRAGNWYCTPDGGASWTTNPLAFETLGIDGAEANKILFGRYVPSIDPAVHLIYTTTDCGATYTDKSGANANLVDGGGDSVPYIGGVAQQGVIVYAYDPSILIGGGFMSSANEYFDADMGVIWVQPDGTNTKAEALLCASTDGFDEPYGDVTSRMCRTSGGFKVSTRAQGLPGEATLEIETYLSKQRDWLQEQARKHCPMPVYLHWSHCPPNNLFLNYEHGERGSNGIITNRSGAGSSRGHADSGDGAADASMKTWSISAEPTVTDYWPLVEVVRDVAEAEAHRSIAFCNFESCGGACGEAEGQCEDGVIVPDATGGVKADVWLSTNGFLTGAAAVGALNYAVAINVSSVTCFHTERDTVRIIVARGTTEAGDDEPLNYSDNSGATWGEITVGANGSFAAGGRSLFSLDNQHVWYGTDGGVIWFSADGGITWADQDSQLTEDIMAIHFCDYNYGMAVGGTAGATGVGARTTDGGAGWTPFTTPLAASEMATCVTVIDSRRAWITTEDGKLYYTEDFGDTWTARTLPKTPTKLGAVQFINEYDGCVVGNYNATSDYAIMYRTFNGGYDWEAYVCDTAFDGALAYFGLNAVWMCDINNIYAVGEQVNSVGLIMQLQAPGV